MAELSKSIGDRLGQSRFAAAQGIRSLWYGAHYALARRRSAGFTRPGEPAFTPSMGKPSIKALRQAYFDLFRKDRANVEAGLYPAPKDVRVSDLASAMRRSHNFLADVSEVDRRRLDRNGTEVRALEASEKYPVYYRQNFHYQSGGWLTDESADIYDTQVEVLFTGAADAMRRQALAAIGRELKGRHQASIKLLDLACGTGRFLHQVMDAYPRLQAMGLDLSPAYVAKAREAVRPWRHVDIFEGQAEAMALDDDSLDIVVNIYLFHELPPKVRPLVAAEVARVLKPGGAFVLADSLQFGDNPKLDGILEYFPEAFHEPYYKSYLAEDFAKMFGAIGLEREHSEAAFLTNVSVWRKT